MSMLESIRRAFMRKDSQARVLVSVQQSGQYVPTPREFKGYAEEGYSKNVIAFRSVSVIAQSAGTIPWLLYKKRKSRKSRREEIEQHPILDLIRRPNPMQGQAAFIESLISYRLISGNGYIESVGISDRGRSEIRELWALRPDRVSVKPGPRGYPAAFIYKVGNGERVFLVDFASLKSSIMHWKTFNPLNDWYGMSPISAAAVSVDQHNAGNKWNTSLLQNSARPSVALVASVNANAGNLTDDQFKRLKEQMTEGYSGPSNAGRPILLEGGMDVKPFSFSPQDMEWIQGKHTSARDISLTFGVPPMLLGIPGDNTYSNYQEARAALYEDTVLPLTRGLRDEWGNWLVPGIDENTELDIDVDGIDALAGRRQTYWDKVNAARHLTLNEKREAMGYEPVDGGDVILVSGTEMPLSEIGMSQDDSTDAGDTSDYTGTDEDDQDDEDPEEDADDSDEDSGKGMKVFNVSSRRAKIREWKAQQRLRKQSERRLMRQAQAVFEIEANRVSDAVKGLDPEHAIIAASHEVDANQAQWRSILKANLRATSKVFGERVFRSLKGMPGAIETKEAQSRFDQFVLTWIENHVGERIKLVSQTTKEKIIKAIRDAEAEAFEAGDSVQELSKKIEAAYSGFSRGRAITIARTETGTTANVALTEAAKATGVPGLKKEWVWTNDERTREDHKLKDAIVGIHDEFEVGGFKMAQPMDPKGPPEEVINCRCGVVFLRGDGAGAE